MIAAEVGVDLGELEVHRRAAAAPLEVGLDLAVVALREPLADVAAEVLGDPAALGLGGLGEVRGQERLAEPLAGPVGEGGDGVGAHPEQRGDVGGLLPLDLEVPQDQLPPLGQRGERLGRGPGLELLHRGVLERHARVELATCRRRWSAWTGRGSGRRAAGVRR